MRLSVSRINHLSGLKLSLTNGFKDASKGCIGSNAKNGSNLISSIRPHSTMLAEVGRFVVRQPEGICYPAGQPFLHRVFGYRGVILFPWLARVHDIDIRKQCSDDGMESHHSNPTKAPNMMQEAFGRIDLNPKQAKQSKTSKRTGQSSPNSSVGLSNHHLTRFHPYYQVLIDTRDCPFVSNRTQTEAVTFLDHPVKATKGLDYVAHEDILPYISHEDQPIQHERFNELFKYDPDAIPLGGSKFVPSDELDTWHKKHTRLELSRVYRETTENIRVTVIPFYLGRTTMENTSFHWWRYCVRLENFSDSSVQLRERHWKIFSQTNMLQTIKGRGVVGVEPLLTKSEPAYQYSSHVNLQDKSGHMWGTFKMQRSDGFTFECRIPPFSLESSMDVTTPPSSKHRSLDHDDDDDHNV